MKEKVTIQDIADALGIVPDLGGDKHFVSGQAAGTYAPSDFFFIFVSGCRIKKPVAHDGSGADRLFGFSFPGHFVHAEAEYGHLCTRVEFDRIIHRSSVQSGNVASLTNIVHPSI